MPAPLRLTLTDYLDPTRWRWVLSDARGGFLADHTVRLDSGTREYQGFVDLAGYLDFYRAAYPPERQLADLGAWVGEQVFGGLRAKLWTKRAQPAVAVHVIVPDSAQELLFRPFELARFDNRQSFRQAGIRFVYRREGAEAPTAEKPAADQVLRILAVFSLPVSENPLNLRRERYGLQHFVRELNQTKGRAVELRVLQYGATRAMLEDALQEGEGWDLVHLSGHGDRGALLLEDDKGGTDSIDADELGDLLANASERLKLLILDACYSGAGSHAAARVQLGLDEVPVRETGAQGEALAETARTVLPSLAQSLAERLDCAALAMRYPVGDAFATELMLALYDKLLEKRRPLPAALQLALDQALASNTPQPPLSFATPILLGERAAELKLEPPQRPLGTIAPPTLGLTFFEREPERFVGRLQPMLRASQALASHSPERGVLFYGMPGAGKTACALELTYRHAENRFAAHVWYQAPQAGSDIATALSALLLEIQRQLNAPDLGLTTDLADPARFRQYTLPKLRALLQQYALLLVLDNLETLLSDSGHWRDPLWGEVLATLLSHNGPSRVVLTSRRVPADLTEHPRLQLESIHALSLAESVLLARELPHLNALFGDDAGLKLLQHTLRAVQGHPKLLELADGLAADRNKLKERLAAAETELTQRGEILEAFFAIGVPQEGETRLKGQDFMRELQGWTTAVAAGLPPTARLLFEVLASLEPEDRRRDALDANWKDILTRLGGDHSAAQNALAEPELGLSQALETLAKVGLIGVEPPAELSAEQQTQLEAYLAEQNSPPSLNQWLDGYRTLNTGYTIHPGVAEVARAVADPAVTGAADLELGNYHLAVHRRALEDEQQGEGETVVASARRAAPYLLRQQRWSEASNLLENLLHRDTSPEAVAFVLPLLSRIAEATRDSEREGIDAGLLAKALAEAGKAEEAETQLRALIQRSVDHGEYRTASTHSTSLVVLLRKGGRLGEALALAEDTAGYTRQAGLGPWTQLSDEGRRLQVMAKMGRYDEVLEAVQALRVKMAQLPETSEEKEAAMPWNVREATLDTGRSAAMNSGRYEQALELNADIIKSKAQRGAEALELARTRFNDYGPLLRLQRYEEARALLLNCRKVFEDEHAIDLLGRVWTALADLADRTGQTGDAVRFEEIALDYSYQAGQPESCAISHHNLANYLERQGADTTAVLAHRLADAIICYQTQSGGLSQSLHDLAVAELPPQAPGFAAVADEVERIDGVRFRALFERLPRMVPDGDAAIAAVWQLATEERQRRLTNKERQQAVLDGIPEAIRAAFELDGEAFSAALREALAALPVDEAEAHLRELREAGLIGGSGSEVPEGFEPLLQDIAAVARGDEGPRAEIEELLPPLEQKGWKLTEPVHRIWADERDALALTTGLDPQDAAIVRRVLELIASPPGER